MYEVFFFFPAAWVLRLHEYVPGIVEGAAVSNGGLPVGGSVFMFQLVPGLACRPLNSNGIEPLAM